VKEDIREAGSFEWLFPRSHNSAFQPAIAIGSHDEGIEETVIMAVIRGAYIAE
jgi:hypothetical protein